ncbi:MAG TPA: hypothetical protein VM490_21975 [Armatimonadaceae bacterium]|nr:hypothetical protein [Armatimonadaceae bacterium]
MIRSRFAARPALLLALATAAAALPPVAPRAAAAQEAQQAQQQSEQVQVKPEEAAEKQAAADPRVKAALEKLKYAFTVNANKAYVLTFTLKDQKRTQAVFVNSSTEKYGPVEVREVTSTAYKVKGKIAADQAQRLLADNDRRKWGAWRTVEDGDATFVIYAVQLPADADAETLDNAIDAVMFTADAMENEMTKADDF